jgi:hypothetical protein
VTAYEKITGTTFNATVGDVRERLGANLRKAGLL